MTADDSSIQRIARLVPLHDVLALIESRVAAVAPQACPLETALGKVLAQDVLLLSPQPPLPIALRDGFAVDADAVRDAGPYAPLPLPPQAARIDTGAPLPAGATGVLPLDAVVLQGGGAMATAAVTPGDGVLPAGGDASAAVPLRRAGERLRAVDAAVIKAAGVAEAAVRYPSVRIVCASATQAPVIDAALDVLCRGVPSAGCAVFDTRHEGIGLDAALQRSDTDAIIAVGGTGSGRRDAAVRTLARIGEVAAHGIAIAPGETTALGFVGHRPVLLMPGRIDAVLAAWLLIGRPLLARLAGGGSEDFFMTLPLQRKIASSIGLAELVPVDCSGGMAQPLGSGYLSSTALARSTGWVVVPAGSEGFAAGTPVDVRQWP